MTVTQINGENLFVSEVISDRYQILESTINHEFFVWDTVRGDNLRNKDGSILYFAAAEAARHYVSGTKAPRKRTKAEPVKAAKVTQRKVSAAAVMRELIKTTDMCDEQILEKMKEVAPTSTYNLSIIKWNRKQLAKMAA